MACPCLEGFACIDGVCRAQDGAGGASSSGASGGAGAGVSLLPSSDGCTGALALSGGITVDGLVQVRVDGCWSLTFTEASRWQPTSWFDLASDPESEHNLAAQSGGDPLETNLLFMPAYISAGPWLTPEDVPEGDVTAALEDGTPAYVTLTTHLRWNGAPSADLPELSALAR